MLTQVGGDGKPVIVRRNGADIAAVIPVEVVARNELADLGFCFVTTQRG